MDGRGGRVDGVVGEVGVGYLGGGGVGKRKGERGELGLYID